MKTWAFAVLVMALGGCVGTSPDGDVEDEDVGSQVDVFATDGFRNIATILGPFHSVDHGLHGRNRDAHVSTGFKAVQ